MTRIGNIVNSVTASVSKIPEVLNTYVTLPPPRPIPYIDMSKDTIVIWVPGTSNHDIHPRFKYHADLYWGSNASLVLTRYMASWHLSHSIPDGFQNLKAIVDYVIKRKRPGQRIVLAGESQGALIIGELMARPDYYRLIDKAVLLGHPGLSEVHYDNDKKVLEINNPADPATFQWPAPAVDIISNVDKFMTKGDLGTIPFFLRTAIAAPLLVADLVSSQVIRLPILREHIPHPHNYSSRMEEAVLWLMDTSKKSS